MVKHLSALVCFLTCGVLVGCERPQPKVAATKPPVVMVSLPVFREIIDYEEFPGRTDAVFTVEVRSRVAGYLDKVNFKDGDEVRENDVLFEIDPRPFKADLDRTAATLEQSQAHLKRLEADNRRAQNLFKRGAIGQEEFDRITGDFAEAQAAVGIAQANRDLARLSLEYTKVKAPISGRASRRLVDPGNLVKADETSLTTIVSLDPMHLYFDIDEGTLLRIQRLVREGKVKSRQEAEVPVLAALSDDAIGLYPYRGVINFSDNKVDPNTGTLRVRGVIENPKIKGRNVRVLSPGLFMRVRLPIGDPRKAIMIPEQALGTDQGRRFVYVVNDKNEAVYRPLGKVGPMHEGLRVVEEGIAPGDRIIVSGLQRVKPGAKVEPKAMERPKDEPPSIPASVGAREKAEGKTTRK